MIHINKYDNISWCDLGYPLPDGDDIEGSGAPADPGAADCKECLHAIIIYAKLAEQRLNEMGLQITWCNGKLFLTRSA